MGASSSNRDHRDYSTSDILNKIRQAEDETKSQQYDSEVNSHIDNVLSSFNNRDTHAISANIDSIKRALNAEIEGTVSTRFGGSISKNTHINGISDIDTLVILNNSELSEKSPQEVLTYFYNKLKKEYGVKKVIKGDISVTVKFENGDVQLLPAIKFKSGLKIPDGNSWSAVIKPTLFARRLTVLNQRLGGRLIPAIKVIKGINVEFPENMRLKGYHIESLALQIFEGKIHSEGSLSNKDLIISFFKEAANSVRNPIKDISKQSQYVDDYLGEKGGLRRIMAADVLDRTYRKLQLADSGRLIDIWKEIIVKD
jgi:hypothetical protein